MQKITLKNKLLFVVMLLIVLIACEKDKLPDEKSGSIQLTNNVIEEISQLELKVITKLSCSPNIVLNQFGHAWSEDPLPDYQNDYKTAYTEISIDSLFSSTLIDLKLNSTYYVRPYAITEDSLVYGDQSIISTYNNSSSNQFTFVISSNYLRNNPLVSTRGWIAVYSEMWNLIYFQEIENSNIYVADLLNESKSNKYHVQLLKFADSEESSVPENRYSIDNYLSVFPSIWYWGNEQTENTSMGTNIIFMPQEYNADDYNINVYKNKHGYGIYNQYDNAFQFEQYFADDDILILFKDYNAFPYFTWIESVQPNQNFELEFLDFEEGTGYALVTFPANISCTAYIESEDDLSTDIWEYYELDLNTSSAGDLYLELYYPENIFDGYFTYLTCRTDDYSQTNLKLNGDILTSFVEYPIEFIVLNSNISEFEANIQGSGDLLVPPFNKYEDLGSLIKSFNISFTTEISNNLQFDPLPIPEEFRLLDEVFINLSAIELNSSIFYDFNGIENYSDYILKQFAILESIYKYSDFRKTKMFYSYGMKMPEKNDVIEEVRLIKNK